MKTTIAFDVPPIRGAIACESRNICKTSFVRPCLPNPLIAGQSAASLSVYLSISLAACLVLYLHVINVITGLMG